MGISGLLPVLKEIQVHGNISDFKGKRLAVDVRPTLFHFFDWHDWVVWKKRLMNRHMYGYIKVHSDVRKI
jgi:hypothetical protein